MCYWVSQTINVLLELLQAPKRTFIALMDAVKGVSYLEQSKEQKLICCYNNDGEVFVGSLQLQRVTMVKLLVPTKATIGYFSRVKSRASTDLLLQQRWGFVPDESKMECFNGEVFVGSLQLMRAKWSFYGERLRSFYIFKYPSQLKTKRW
ncbi:hypothetical protein L6452_42008 [Arctium lappa]|uniref:Uncharacterized protein n=1 Tax=Arctium lappa TaxID=4217 RepID=A0ACB8XHN4_ARCLA|nr:hypothetical protein L6452_42008 [Arctium lappa]